MALKDTKMFRLTGVGTSIQFGKGGSKLKLNGTALEALNAAESAYVKMHAAHPAMTDINGLATVGFVLAHNNPIVSQEIYDNAGTPDVNPAGNPTVGDILVCTEATGAFTAGHVYRLDVWDTDIATSTWTDVTVDGFTILVTANLSTGGTFTFLEDHLYTWDTTTWDLIGPAPSANPPSQYNRAASIAYDDASLANDIGAALTYESVVTRVLIDVGTAWNGSTGDATVTVGVKGGDADAFAEVSDSDLQVVGTYIIDQHTTIAAAATIESTRVADTSADESAGAADIIVFLSDLNAE